MDYNIILSFLLTFFVLYKISIYFTNPNKPGIMSDKDIRNACKQKNPMISPFNEGSDGISSGVSSYGYDAILHNTIYLFHNNLSTNETTEKILDPKNFDDTSFETIKNDDYFILPPHAFALGRTKEYFKIPENVLVICLGKSTYARCGLVVNVTPLEPGWEGHVTLEFSNTTPYPIKMYSGEGICQFIFFKAYERCQISYKDKRGKYMDQKDIVLAKYK